MKLVQTKVVSEQAIVADIRSTINQLCSLMNEATLRDITVNFSINKNSEGQYEATLDLTKKL